MDNSDKSKRKPLPKREAGIGRRLKQARESLRFTQEEFARQVGITRQRMASYEELRAPLRFDLALKICRQFILSEKWLATGQGEMRLCLDLNSRGVSHQAPIDTPFGQAYDAHLGAVYETARAQEGDGTSLIIHDPENFNFLENYFIYLLGLWTEDLPRARKVPAGFSQMLCTTLVRLGLEFVEFSLREQRLPTPEDLLVATIDLKKMPQIILENPPKVKRPRQ